MFEFWRLYFDIEPIEIITYWKGIVGLLTFIEYYIYENEGTNGTRSRTLVSVKWGYIVPLS